MKTKISNLFNTIKKWIISIFTSKDKRKFTIFWISFTVVIFASTLTASICAYNYPNYIYISDEEDLEEIRNNLNGDFIFLKQNIAITNPDFEPIGTPENPFTGTIKGNHCTIGFDLKEDENFKFVEGKEANYFGFFGANEGTIWDLNFYINGSTIEHDDSKDLVFGVVSAYNYGSISGCSVKKRTNNFEFTTTKDLYAGGICGIGNHNIVKTSNSIGFKVKTAKNCYLGGLIGMTEDRTDIWESQSSGDILVEDCELCYAGGLVGYANIEIERDPIKSSITNCKANCKIEVNSKTDSISASVIAKGSDAPWMIKNVFSSSRIKSSENVKISYFFGEGSFELFGCVVVPSTMPEYCANLNGAGYFSYDDDGLSKTRNCYYTHQINTEPAFYVYSGTIYKDMKDLKLSFLNWDSNIWSEKDGSFFLA